MPAPGYMINFLCNSRIYVRDALHYIDKTPRLKLNLNAKSEDLLSKRMLFWPLEGPCRDAHFCRKRCEEFTHAMILLHNPQPLLRNLLGSNRIFERSCNGGKPSQMSNLLSSFPQAQPRPGISLSAVVGLSGIPPYNGGRRRGSAR